MSSQAIDNHWDFNIPTNESAPSLKKPGAEELSSLALFSLTAKECEKMAEGKQPEEKANEKRLFKAAGVLAKLGSEGDKALENELDNQLKIMQTEIDAMEKMAKFWEKFAPLWEKFQNDPSNFSRFKEVIEALKEEYKSDPDKEDLLEKIEKEGVSAHNKEEEWEAHGWWYHLFHGMSLSDPDAYNKAIKSIKEELKGVPGKDGAESALFQNLFTANQQNFQSRIQGLLTTIRLLKTLVTTLEKSEGSATEALLHLEAFLMELEALQINTNTEKSDQEQTISQATAKNLEQNLKKIEESLKKLGESHSGGLWGWIKDLCSFVVETIKGVAEGVYDGVTGQTDQAKQAFEKIGNHAFIKDMGNLFKLIGNLWTGIAKLEGSLVLILTGQVKAAKELFESAKEDGEKVLANPALKVIADVAMVAMIVASCLTGQFGLALVMLSLFVLTQTGTLQKGTEQLAKALTDAGCDPKVAKVLADIIIIAVVTVVSAGAGAAQAALTTGLRSAARVAFQEAEEIEMANLASGAEQETAQVASQSSAESAAGSSSEGASSKGASLTRQSLSTGAYGLGSTLGSSTLALDVLDAMHKKDNQTLAIILELIQVIAAAITASVGAATSISQTLPNSLNGAKNASHNLAQLAHRIVVTSSVTGGVVGMANGGEQIIQGNLLKNLERYKANVQLGENTQKVTSQMIEQVGKELEQIIKQYESLIATLFRTPGEIAGSERAALQA